MRDSAVATVFGAGLFMMVVWSQSWAGPAHQADQAGGWLVGKGTPVTLDHYQCRYQKDCGAASQKCWGAGHEAGGSTCAYCTGSQVQDVCEKSNDGTCPHNGGMQSCGMKWGGVCTGGPVGTCSSGWPLGQRCSVPKC